MCKIMTQWLQPCIVVLQALTVEEAKERREKMAKMRSLLFAHEQKAKRLKAIKSKGFHRHAKKAAKMKVQPHMALKSAQSECEQSNSVRLLDSPEARGRASQDVFGVACKSCCAGHLLVDSASQVT